MLNTATRAVRFLRQRGLRFALAQLSATVRPPRLHHFDQLAVRLRGQQGIEIGGPSEVFRDGGLMPVYSLVGALDGCNFATETMWEGNIQAGQSYRFADGRLPGLQHIREASNLTGIADGRYDFLLSSHCLEHAANPLKALQEWVRIVKPGGTLVVIVPDRRQTFDRRRPVTAFAHLLEDHARNMGEDDLTHLDEILRLHDLELDPVAGGPAAFAARARANAQNRGLHHHVFDPALLEQALRWAGVRPLHLEAHFPFHIVALAEK
jgi:SAM-dependent methyltransferase